MGTKTALQIVASYARQRGLPVPTALFAATDTGSLQLLESYNNAGRYLCRKKDWQWKKKRKTLVALATEDQGVLVTLMGEDPANISFDSFYNETTRLPIWGPMTDQAYQSDKILIPSGPFQEFKIYNGHLFILGGVTAGHTLSMMYTSRNWLQTAVNVGGTLAEVAADTNVSVFPDDLMQMTLDYMWRKEKDMDYSAQLAAVTNALLDDDGGTAPALRMDSGSQTAIKPGIIVPAGSWNQ